MYKDIFYTNFKIRTFDDVDEFELKWHTDEFNRFLEVLNDNDWRFQFDNQLPFKLPKNLLFYIPNTQYHRLLKGTTKLIIKIVEM